MQARVTCHVTEDRSPNGLYEYEAKRNIPGAKQKTNSQKQKADHTRLLRWRDPPAGRTGPSVPLIQERTSCDEGSIEVGVSLACALT